MLTQEEILDLQTEYQRICYEQIGKSNAPESIAKRLNTAQKEIDQLEHEMSLLRIALKTSLSLVSK